MARLVTCGFEIRRLGAESALISSFGSPVFVTTPVRSGNRALRCDSGSAEGMVVSVTSEALDRDYFIRCALRWSGNPASSNPLISPSNANFSLNLGTSGNLVLFDSLGSVIKTVTGLSANTWYVVEINYRIPTSGNGSIVLKIDGTTQHSGSPNLANVITGGLNIGNNAGESSDIFLDDFAMNDDQGASSQVSFPGHTSHIVCLFPLSDNARTGWTGGNPSAGSTTNLWDALDANPPAGVADASGTNTSQIRDPNNNSTDTYEAVLAAYTDALASGGGGMAADDYVRVYTVIARGGNSTTTSRTLACKGVSNPNTTEGTAASGTTAAASDPTGWTPVRSQSIDPTIGQGNAVGPVAQVRKGTASANVMLYDLLVGQVEYQSPVAIPLGTSAASASATIAVTAKTQIPLGTAAASASATIAITAKTEIPLDSSPVSSSATLALTAPTRVPLGSAAASSSATIAVNAPTQVALGSSPASSSATLTLTAPTQVPLATSAASASASLAFTAKTEIPLASSDASASATLAVSAKTQIALGSAAASSSATAAVTAATRIALGSAAATSTATAVLNAPTEVGLSAAGGTSAAATLTLSAKTEIPLGSADATSTADLPGLDTPMIVLLDSADAESTASLSITARALITLTAAGQSSATLGQIVIPRQVDLTTANGVATGALHVSAPTLVPLDSSDAVAAAVALITAPTYIDFEGGAQATSTAANLALRAPHRWSVGDEGRWPYESDDRWEPSTDDRWEMDIAD